MSVVGLPDDFVQARHHIAKILLCFAESLPNLITLLRPARDFGGMRGENWNNLYCSQDLERLSGLDSSGAHAPERAPERAFQCRLLGMQLGGTPPPLAMVGFGKVGEFEINRECLGDTMGLINREAGDNLARLVQQRIFEIRRGSLGARLFPVLNEDPPQLLDHTQQRLTHLFDQDASQQDSEQAHITPEREVLGGIHGAGSQLVETAALVTSTPK